MEFQFSVPAMERDLDKYATSCHDHNPNHMGPYFTVYWQAQDKAMQSNLDYPNPFGQLQGFG